MDSQQRLALTRIAIVLFPIAIALAVTIFAEWTLLPNAWPPVPRPTDLSSRYAAPETTPYTAKPLSAFEEVGKRTLFLASRGQVATSVAPEEPQPSAQPLPTPSLPRPAATLMAVILTPRQQLALIQLAPSEPTIGLEPGDDLNGWKLVAIHDDRIELQAGDEVQTLYLLDVKPLEDAIQDSLSSPPTTP